MATGNALLDTADTPQQPTAANGAKRIIRLLNENIQFNQRSLESIRQVVDRWTRPALLDEFGDDAAELVAIYNRIKNLVESSAPNINVPDIP